MFVFFLFQQTRLYRYKEIRPYLQRHYTHHSACVSRNPVDAFSWRQQDRVNFYRHLFPFSRMLGVDDVATTTSFTVCTAYLAFTEENSLITLIADVSVAAILPWAADTKLAAVETIPFASNRTLRPRPLLNTQNMSRTIGGCSSWCTCTGGPRWHRLCAKLTILSFGLSILFSGVYRWHRRS